MGTGSEAVHADSAVRLGDLPGTSAEVGLGMQSAHDLWIERRKDRPAIHSLAS